MNVRLRNRCFVLLVVLWCVNVVPICKADFPLRQGSRVLFIGDSITQDGRYVDFIQGYIWARYPDRNLTIINAGLSSETVSGITEPIHPFPRPNIQDRLERVLQLAKPDTVFVCYGMNDGIYHPIETRISEAYRLGLESVLSDIHASGARVYLLSPPVFDVESPAVQKALAAAGQDEPYGYRRPFENYNQTLKALTEIAGKYENDIRVAGVINVHQSTSEFLVQAKLQDPQFVYGDGVHPPLEGHAAIASSVLVGLGEKAEDVERTFATCFNVRMPGYKAEAISLQAEADQVREMLFKRGRELSTAVRKLVGEKNDRAAIEPFESSKVFTEAKEAEFKVRELLVRIQ